MKDPHAPLIPGEIIPPSHWREGIRQEITEKFENEAVFKNVSIKDAVQTGVRMLERLDNTMRNIEEVRQANLNDLEYSTTTKLGAKVKTYEYAQQKKEELRELSMKGAYKARNSMEKLDSEIEREISTTAARGRYADETRRYIRELPEDERVSFIRSLIRDQDWESCEEILGVGRPFLVGLSDQQLNDLKSLYKKTRYADKIKARDLLSDLAEKFEVGFQAATTNLKTLESPEVKKAISKRNKDRKLMNG